MTVCLEKASQTDERPQPSQEKNDGRIALKVLARYFPETSQVYKSVKEKLDRDEPRKVLHKKKAIPSSKAMLANGSDEPNKKQKPDHNFLIEQRAEIQYLVDFHSSRVELLEFPSDPFSKRREVFTMFKLIVLDKEPVTKVVLCSKCRKLLVRYRPSGTNLIRHYQRHMKNQEEEKEKVKKQSSKWRVDEFRKGKGQYVPKDRVALETGEDHTCAAIATIPAVETSFNLGDTSTIHALLKVELDC